MVSLFSPSIVTFWVFITVISKSKSLRTYVRRQTNGQIEYLFYNCYKMCDKSSIQSKDCHFARCIEWEDMRLHLDMLKLLHFAFCYMPLSSKIDCVCQVFERIRAMGSNFTWITWQQAEYSNPNSRNVSQSLWLKSFCTIEELWCKIMECSWGENIMVAISIM